VSSARERKETENKITYYLGRAGVVCHYNCYNPYSIGFSMAE
jgi:hypothetical protein